MQFPEAVAPNESGPDESDLCRSSCATALFRDTVGRIVIAYTYRTCPVLVVSGRDSYFTKPVAIMSNSSSRVRKREAVETAHQSRLLLPSAKDHTSDRVFSSVPGIRSADRFIPSRSTSDQPCLDDLSSPPQKDLREVRSGRHVLC